MEPEAPPIGGPLADPQKIIPREAPTVPEDRKALVTLWVDRVVRAKDRWRHDFARMRENQRFARGYQWEDEGPEIDANERSYVINITHRHIQSRTHSVYAKNPKVVSRVRERLWSTVWDGSISQFDQAYQYLAGVGQGMLPPDPAMAAQAQMVVQEAAQVQAQKAELKKVGRTLELLFDYQIREQTKPFKTMMKHHVVRRALTCGVGYVKAGFQRAMQPKPEIERQINDVQSQIDAIERLSADVADGELLPDTAEIEQLRLLLKELQEAEQVLVREGLTFDFPRAAAIIPDPECTYLREFAGARWVAEEHILSVARVKEVYKVDVAKNATRYVTADESGGGSRWDAWFQRAMGGPSDGRQSGENAHHLDDEDLVAVWEVYSRADGLIYSICDGWPDFLTEPAPPDVWTERFWPWYVYAPNECDDDSTIFPPSDVELIRDAQMELNRARQGLREHRLHSWPKVATSAGVLSEEDKEKLEGSPAFAILELQGLAPGQKVEDLLQDFRGLSIDPNLYETNSAFEDVLRAVGTQEANLGGATGATATESSIAESSRMSTVQAMIDELDDLLTHLARAAGQIMLAELSQQTVMTIVGPGAVWPQMDREQLAAEVFLEIEAGSTGRPNKAAEVQNFERLAPFLMQMPGITPQFLAKEALRRLDDKIDLADAYLEGHPSITAMNAAKPMGVEGAGAGEGRANGQSQGAGQGPGSDPAQQGAQGRNNAPKPNGRQPGGPPNPAQQRAAGATPGIA